MRGLLSRLDVTSWLDRFQIMRVPRWLVFVCLALELRAVWQWNVTRRLHQWVLVRVRRRLLCLREERVRLVQRWNGSSWLHLWDDVRVPCQLFC